MKKLESLHKKVHLIGALKMEKGKDPCRSPACSNCALNEYKAYETCVLTILNRKDRANLCIELEKVIHPTPFLTVKSARKLIAKLI